MLKKGSKILVAMSGGVDSSVAALLLKEEGFEIIGVSLNLYSCHLNHSKSCCSAADRLDARRVCEQLQIPFIALDYREQFQKQVITPFAHEYLNGRTPSPCILCNQHLKFHALEGEMSHLGATGLATGHYARVRQCDDGSYHLLRGVDSKKDQSYFLFPLRQESLGHIFFPLGELTKQEVRQIAKKHHLPTSEKGESQEICFITDGDYASFIEERNPSQIQGPGDFVTCDGIIVGRHRGIHAYTIGQRRGLGFGIGERQYVVGINPGKNEITLGSNEDLFRREMIVHHVHWISPMGDEALVEDIEVQIRSAHAAAKADIKLLSGNEVHVIFEKPQRAIAPGQAAVFYRGEEVIGGGWIV